MHEFAHYLLNIEEIDDDDDDNLFVSNSNIENWCHYFAYYFLLGNKKTVIDKLEKANKSNVFNKLEVEDVYNNSKLSYKAIYTNLLLNNKISKDDYQVIIAKINENIRESEIREQIKKD